MHLLYIVSIDISIQKKKIAFIAMLHHFILSFLILFIYLQYARIDVKVHLIIFLNHHDHEKNIALIFDDNHSYIVIVMRLAKSKFSEKSSYNSCQSKNQQPELRY